MVHDVSNMAAATSKNPSLLEQLEPLLGIVPEAEVTAALKIYGSCSESELKLKVDALERISTERGLKDGGDKALKQCQVIQAVLKHKREKVSKNWRQQVTSICVKRRCKASSSVEPHCSG